MTEKIAGYILEKKIARGGMAEVFLASKEGPEGFKKQVAIKRIHEHLTDHAGLKTMFLDEARLVAQLSHPNIVQIFDMGQAGDRLFLAMEFIDGLDLARILNQCEAKGKKLPFEIAAHLTAEVSLGLDYAHEFVDQDGQHLNIIHRDISPQNIMVTHEGVVKIVDFGIAKAASNLYKTKTVSMKGKLQYMSPEQIKGHVAMDRRTDVYSTGVVLYQMLTHQVPHKAPSDITLMKTIVTSRAPDPRELTPDTPAELARIVNHALQRDRDKRYPSSRELRSDLTRFLNQKNESIDTYVLKEFLQNLAHSEEPQAQDSDKKTADKVTAPIKRTTPLSSGKKIAAKNLTTWMLAAFSVVAFGIGFFVLFGHEGEETTPSVNPSAQPDPAWEKRAALRTQEKKEKLLKLFFSRLNQGRRFAEDASLLHQALQELQEAQKIAKEIDIDESIQTEIQTLLDKTRKSLKKRDQQQQEQAALALDKKNKRDLQTAREQQNQLNIKKKIQKQRSSQKRKSNKVLSLEIRAQGIRFYKEKNMPRAITAFHKALKLNPSDSELLRSLGSAYAASGNAPKAFAYYNKFITQCPTCSHAPGVRYILRKYNQKTK
ncbi:MAG: protein kinase [Deltaproteobacteria bacterium]|nr:protein kinase [Deltaproteobacteria bacterium]